MKVQHGVYHSFHDYRNKVLMTTESSGATQACSLTQRDTSDNIVSGRITWARTVLERPGTTLISRTAAPKLTFIVVFICLQLRVFLMFCQVVTPDVTVRVHRSQSSYASLISMGCRSLLYNMLSDISRSSSSGYLHKYHDVHAEDRPTAVSERHQLRCTAAGMLLLGCKRLQLKGYRSPYTLHSVPMMPVVIYSAPDALCMLSGGSNGQLLGVTSFINTPILCSISLGDHLHTQALHRRITYGSIYPSGSRIP